MQAILSEDRVFRYRLRREVAQQGLDPSRALVWLMLNPSTADEAADDPTIRKCLGFAARFGFGAVEVVNLWAFRATDPLELKERIKRGLDAIGPENDRHVQEAVAGRIVVAAWGATKVPGVVVRATAARRLCSGAEDVLCLGTSRSGDPRHPLMLAYSTPLCWPPWHPSKAGRIAMRPQQIVED